MKKWVLYIISLGFAAYWASNLLLWFPWSYSTELGITLMLTVAPILWAYIVFLGLKSCPKVNLFNGAAIIALILLLLAVILDYIFFALIRNAREQLYHPTTFYGYAFLIVLPFIIALIYKNKMRRLKKKTTSSIILKILICGMACLVLLTLIIILGIKI